MAFTTLTQNLDIIQALPDEPSDVGSGGLSAAQLKEKFDLAANYIKAYLNDVLVPELIAANMPFTDTEGLSATDVNAAINETYAAIAAAAAAEIIDGSVTFAKLATAAIANQATAEAGTSSTTLTTPQRVAQYVAYIIASLAEAQAGSSDAKIMTPSKTASYVTAILANQAEAEAGVNATKLMVPVRVKQEINALRYRAEIATATWSESIDAEATVVKTIAHSIGAIPSRVRLFFNFGSATATVDAIYSGGNYEFTMSGFSYNSSSSAAYNYATWKRSLIANSSLFGLYVGGVSYDTYFGSYALAQYRFELTDITFSSSAISISIKNTHTSALGLTSTVTAEVYA